MRFKVFGERNTGTNAFTQMMKRNSSTQFHPSTISELSPMRSKVISMLSKAGLKYEIRETLIDSAFYGRPTVKMWKHSATNFYLGPMHQTHFIFMVRHPLSWLIGLFRKPYHILVNKPQTLSEFSDLNWKVLRRDNVSKTHYKPLELYSEKLESYLFLIGQLEKNGIPYTVLKFEDLVTNQKRVFERLSPNLIMPNKTFVELSESTKDTSKNSQFYASYYSNEIWRSEFPEIESICNPLSNEAMSFFGYS